MHRFYRTQRETERVEQFTNMSELLFLYFGKVDFINVSQQNIIQYMWFIRIKIFYFKKRTEVLKAYTSVNVAKHIQN